MNREISEASGLMNEVWSSLKATLLKKYQHCESLVQECYKQKLAFPPEKLNTIFADVEKKWSAKAKKLSSGSWDPNDMTEGSD